MKMIFKIITIAARLFLGGMMVYGGIGKFQKPLPSPQEVVLKANKFTDPGKTETLQKVLYINGMKQTGYAWQILGVCELLFGILLLIQFTGWVGAVLVLPITVHIFCFHLFLESDEIGELLLTALLLIANFYLIFLPWKSWKHLLWQKI